MDIFFMSNFKKIAKYIFGKFSLFLFMVTKKKKKKYLYIIKTSHSFLLNKSTI